ncbi:MAG: transcription antitermination factor NusB [Deltaproteobacteria bacterium]|nr:transcription antitermination factor NusB [Deltaproteobacteria bacterium]
MGNRRRSRELAMQALFFMDVNRNISDEMVDRFCDGFNPPLSERPFFLELVKGVISTLDKLDSIIERFSKNWRMSRMSPVDRNIMRIAAYEIIFCSDIPSKVSINEAVDIGKKFGTEESGAFINGIIDSIRIAHEKKDFKIEVDEGMTLE